MKVIDISYAQGKSVDWEKVKASGVEGAILRIGYGRETSQKDSTFEINVKGCQEAGIQFLPYHYSYATDEAGARKEAACFLAWAEGHEFARKLVFFDVEEKSQYNLSQKKIRALIDAYADELQKYGWEVGVYSYKIFLDKLDPDWLDRNFLVWAAQYASACTYSGRYELWQYTSSGKIDGVSGNVDLSNCYNEALFQKEEPTMKTLTHKTPTKSSVQTLNYSEYGNCTVTPHIKLSELRCSDGSDTIKLDWYTVNAVEAARVFFAKPILITSAYRTAAYNKKIGGASGSYHTKGRAIDCYISGISPSLLAKFFQAYGMKGVGCYYDSLFVHVDSRTSEFLWKNQSCTKVSTHLPTIRSGSNGQDVMDAQHLLNMAGAKLIEDGIFGTNTNKEVKNFQRAKGLDVDGIIGRKTWNSLMGL